MSPQAARYLPSRPLDDAAAPWVLLRGLAREQRHWGDFPQRLSEHLGREVICPDTPGNGYRCRDTSPVSIGATLESVRTALGLQRPLNLFGLSMGGMIATEWARRYPAEVETLVLVNTSFANVSPPWARLRPVAFLSLLSSLARSPRRREARVFDLICRRTDDRGQCIDKWAGYAAEHPLARVNFARQLIAAARYRAPSQAPVPATLVLNGRGDRMVAPGCSDAIARRWNLTLSRHPWAGHDLTHDDAPWVLEQIEKVSFVQNTRPPLC